MRVYGNKAVEDKMFAEADSIRTLLDEGLWDGKKSVFVKEKQSDRF